ncbi:hypothetical protein FFLO_00273 [Filobasidium floriforme]|uniref:Uncharacterized protein n=1 Tax=Filobasidium floriforme TaxID=5210 RepID=A0A8K0JRT1_9TREE|nr:uncharacterized protein HD553DRAFT_324882 [Filobasidium floriforme]KAG7575454.1 hypothetical protein FFLO_00273 [Filobasidium floriforme]KAH8082591.1 hypothetical protein HD553DRAFT_324882 [Filobasidium floriforme]
MSSIMPVNAHTLPARFEPGYTFSMPVYKRVRLWSQWHWIMCRVVPNEDSMRDKWKDVQNKRWKKLEDKMDRKAKSQGCPAMTKTANAIKKKFTEGRGRELTLEKVEAKILQATNIRRDFSYDEKYFFAVIKGHEIIVAVANGTIEVIAPRLVAELLAWGEEDPKREVYDRDPGSVARVLSNQVGGSELKANQKDWFQRFRNPNNLPQQHQVIALQMPSSVNGKENKPTVTIDDDIKVEKGDSESQNRPIEIDEDPIHAQVEGALKTKDNSGNQGVAFGVDMPKPGSPEAPFDVDMAQPGSQEAPIVVDMLDMGSPDDPIDIDMIDVGSTSDVES